MYKQTQILIFSLLLKDAYTDVVATAWEKLFLVIVVSMKNGFLNR